MTTPEGRVKTKVKAVLDEFGVYYFMPVQTGFGRPSLDFLCCVCGLFVAIETKADDGKEMTQRQKITAQQIRDSKGLVLLINCNEHIEQLRRLLVRIITARARSSTAQKGADSVADGRGANHTGSAAAQT